MPNIYTLVLVLLILSFVFKLVKIFPFSLDLRIQNINTHTVLSFENKINNKKYCATWHSTVEVHAHIHFFFSTSPQMSAELLFLYLRAF